MLLLIHWKSHVTFRFSVFTFDLGPFYKSRLRQARSQDFWEGGREGPNLNLSIKRRSGVTPPKKFWKTFMQFGALYCIRSIKTYMQFGALYCICNIKTYIQFGALYCICSIKTFMQFGALYCICNIKIISLENFKVLLFICFYLKTIFPTVYWKLKCTRPIFIVEYIISY